MLQIARVMSLDRTTLGARPRARLAVASAALLWATTGVAGVLAPAAATASVLSEARVLLGGLALVGVVGLRRGARPFRHALGWPLLLAGLSLAIFQWCFFAAVRGAGSALAAVVSTGVAPFAGDLLERSWPATRGRRIGACVALTCAAGSWVVARSSLDPELLGWLAAASSGVAYAAYTAVVAHFQRGRAGSAAAAADASLALTALALLGAAIALAPAAIGDLRSLACARGVLSAVYLGVLATALPYAAFVRGLKVLSAGDALALLFLQPLAAAALGWLILGERLSLPTALGTLVLLAAAALRSIRLTALSRSTPKEKTPC